MNMSFRKKTNPWRFTCGTIITLPSPEIAEIFCQLGFDWLFVDLEHSALSIKDAQVILQSAAHKTSYIIRVPSIDEGWIKKALDIGPSGIIIPHVKTVEEAKLVVQLCKYPPEGLRSVGIARAMNMEKNFRNMLQPPTMRPLLLFKLNISML